MKSFYIINTRAGSTEQSFSGAPKKSAKRERLRYRDMIWAFHSDTQEILLNASTSASNNGKMTWADARALGVFLWLNSPESLVCGSTTLRITSNSLIHDRKRILRPLLGMNIWQGTCAILRRVPCFTLLWENPSLFMVSGDRPHRTKSRLLC